MNTVLELVIPRRLESPNRLRGFHWSRRHRETRQWEYELLAAAQSRDALRPWSLITFELRKDERDLFQPHEIRRQERRRVEVEIELRSRAQLIKDDDNLRFCVKPVNDALTRLGLIYDDSRDWLDQPMPVQRLSADKQPRTIIRIHRVDDGETTRAL